MNREGFPLGYESLAGKTRDAATLWPMLGTLEARFGRASRIVCFDRGMATEANLQRLRQSQRLYLCATRRAVVRQHLPAIRSQAWTIVRTTHAQEPTIEVQELPAAGPVPGEMPERWLLCRSAAAVSRNNKCTWLASTKPVSV